jgi:hypothetical protein
MANKRERDRINGWIAKWKPRLLLDNWGIQVEYKGEDSDGKRSDGEAVLTAAEIVVDHRYKEARILVYPMLFTRPVAYQHSTIVHEMLHIATDELRTALSAGVRKGAISAKSRDDLSEGITEYVTKVMFRAYRVTKPTDSYHI